MPLFPKLGFLGVNDSEQVQLARAEGGMGRGGWGGRALLAAAHLQAQTCPPCNVSWRGCRGVRGAGARFTWSAQNRRQVNQVSRRGF